MSTLRNAVKVAIPVLKLISGQNPDATITLIGSQKVFFFCRSKGFQQAVFSIAYI